MRESKKNSSLIIDKIEDLIQKSRHIPQHEVLRLMMKAENNPKIDLKKELAILSEKYNKYSL